MDLQLEGAALVTGASRGIGRAVALALGKAGAVIGVHYHASEEAALELVRTLESRGGRGIPLRANLEDRKGPERLAEEAERRLGRIRILVNNAGLYDEVPLDAPDAPERYQRILRVNLEAPYHLCRTLVRRMEAGSSIVNISSRAGHRGENRSAPYAVSKGGVNLLTVSLARELAPRGIRVNAVAPGWVRTDMAEPFLRSEEARRRIEAETLLGRLATPEEIAGVVLFLVSPRASYITGQVIHVNGGSFIPSG